MSFKNLIFRVERQNLLHLQRSITNDYSEKRGSLEETRRILQEIDRINMALGYTKKMSLAFPRVASGEGYFYPRQQFRPEFLTKRREIPSQNMLRMNNQRAIYPFNNQQYYYPAPYLQVPINGKSQNFKSNKYFYPLVYAPLNVLPYDLMKSNERDADGSIKLGTIVVLPKEEIESTGRSPKAVIEAIKRLENDKKSSKDKKKPENPSLLDQIVNYELEALGLAEEEEDDRQEEVVVSTTRLPAIKNDKFLNLALKKHPQEDENRKVPPPPVPSTIVNRAFNFSNPIEKFQNFTKQFSLSPAVESLRETTTVLAAPSAEDIDEANDEKADDREEDKSPFGFAFGPKQQLQTYKEGGLIIQRLRVRQGGIAIAGPGGVATVNNLLFYRPNLIYGEIILGWQRRNSDCWPKRHRFHTSKVKLMN